VAGGDPPVVLMQSFRSDTSAHFADVVPILAEAGLAVFAIDPPGVGADPRDLNGLTLHDLAAAAGEAIDVLGRGPVHVVASAYAAQVARCLAADQPDRVASLCLASPGAIGKIFPYPASDEALAVYRRIFFETGDARLAAIQEATISPGSGLTARADDYELTAEQALAERTPREDFWAAGSAPLLLLQGLDDRICPPENSRALRAQFADRVRLVEVPGAGHLLARERPDAFRAVVVFVEEVPRSASERLPGALP